MVSEGADVNENKRYSGRERSIWRVPEAKTESRKIQIGQSHYIQLTRNVHIRAFLGILQPNRSNFVRTGLLKTILSPYLSCVIFSTVKHLPILLHPPPLSMFIWSPEIAKFVAQRVESYTNGQPLDSFMIKPVQRIWCVEPLSTFFTVLPSICGVGAS
jgi:hypothetical protein